MLYCHILPLPSSESPTHMDCLSASNTGKRGILLVGVWNGVIVKSRLDICGLTFRSRDAIMLSPCELTPSIITSHLPATPKLASEVNTPSDCLLVSIVIGPMAFSV